MWSEKMKTNGLRYEQMVDLLISLKELKKDYFKAERLINTPLVKDWRSDSVQDD